MYTNIKQPNILTVLLMRYLVNLHILHATLTLYVTFRQNKSSTNSIATFVHVQSSYSTTCETMSRCSQLQDLLRHLRQHHRPEQTTTGQEFQVR
jgi:hypothetical protein